VTVWRTFSAAASRHRSALTALAGGLLVVAAAQALARPGSPALYDGVVSQEPYRWLNPSGGHAGNPTSFHTSLKVTGSSSPQFVAATSESPPQAQLIGGPGAFAVPPGTTAINVTIDPLSAPNASGGQVTGNAYRFGVTDQSGAALSVVPSSALTLVLRAPDGIVDATIAQVVGGSWQPLTTQPAGQPGIFIANVTQLGDFALILPGVTGVFGLDPVIIAVAAGIAVLSAIGLLWVVRSGRRRAAPMPRPRAERPTTTGADPRRRGGRRKRGARRS
jgi:hypothetical protein